jgi:hypothetical protein
VVRSLSGAMVLVAVAAAPLRAQLPQLGVPRGHLRIEIGGDFSAADRRFFDGQQPLAGDWNGDLGGDLAPELAGAEARIRAITGDASYRLSAGRSSVKASTQTGTLVLSAGLGLTKRLSIFGTLPFVRARSQSSLHLDSTSANAGLNPFATQTGTFFVEFDRALDSLSSKIASGFYDGNPMQKAQAIQALADGNALQTEMIGLLADPSTASPYVPTATSTAGTAILGAVAAMQTTLGSLSLGTTFATDPVLPTTRLTEAQFRSSLTSGSYGVGAFLRGDETLQRPGDSEVGVVYTLIDHPSFRVATTGLVRLPTGLLDRSDDFFDLGTGDGQTDIEGRIAADLAKGTVGVRLSLGYNRQLASTIERRIHAPSQPLAFASRLAEVTSDPGDELTLGVEPFIQIAPGFALTFGAFRWKHAADEVTYSGTPLPGSDASDLAIDTERSATALQAGMSYSSFAGVAGRGTPIEGRWVYREVVSASGGRVDRTRRLWFQFRVFYKLW